MYVRIVYLAFLYCAFAADLENRSKTVPVAMEYIHVSVSILQRVSVSILQLVRRLTAVQQLSTDY